MQTEHAKVFSKVFSIAQPYPVHHADSDFAFQIYGEHVLTPKDFVLAG